MVLFLHTDLVNPAKGKFLLVASISRDNTEVGLVIINTNKSPFAPMNPAVDERQWVLPADDRRIVMYDSFADCSQLKTRPYSEVVQWLNTEKVYRGRLNGRELYRVKELLATAPTIATIVKKRLGLL